MAISPGGYGVTNVASGPMPPNPIHIYQPPNIGGAWVGPATPAVIWQSTSSNATYCSAKSALSA